VISGHQGNLLTLTRSGDADVRLDNHHSRPRARHEQPLALTVVSCAYPQWVGERARYSIDDFKAYMKDCFSALSERDPSVTVLKEESVPFTEWEADWFLRGVRDLMLFDVKVHSCTSGFIAAGFEGELFESVSGTVRDAHFFGVSGRKGEGARATGREGVTHMAAIARLVGEYHHPADTIRSESARFEVDIEVFDRPARDTEPRAILGAEVKVRPREHEALAIGMQACRGKGDVDSHREAVRVELGRDVPVTQARNHHKKCRWLAAEQTGTFWIISRDRSSVFAARFPTEGTFQLSPLPDDALEREAVDQRAV
jgi:hypothetical protein